MEGAVRNDAMPSPGLQMYRGAAEVPKCAIGYCDVLATLDDYGRVDGLVHHQGPRRIEQLQARLVVDETTRAVRPQPRGVPVASPHS